MVSIFALNNKIRILYLLYRLLIVNQTEGYLQKNYI